MYGNQGLPTWAVAGLTVVALLGGAALAGWDPEHIAANLLVASYGLLGLGLGGSVLLALLLVTGARWSLPIRPAVERLTVLVPVGAAGVAIVLLAFPSLYPWYREPNDTNSPFQALWLDRSFFLLRSVVYLGLWVGLVTGLVRAARRQADRPAGPGVRIAAVFLVVFALTCWLSAVDWIMSLDAPWSSTMFGIYQFAGMFLGALAALIVLVVWLEHGGYFGGRLTRDHRRDLGTLLFGFSSFWAYTWFCQYLLIWYVNNPEEAGYFLRRQQGPWPALTVASLALNWAVPFLVLLPRAAKENTLVLLAVAAAVLLGRWLDLYLMVLPSVADVAAVRLGADAALLAAATALGVLVLARRLPAAGLSGERS